MLNRRLAESEFRPLGVGSRAINALVSRNICTRKDLAAFTEHQIAAIPGVGANSLAKLKGFLLQTPPPEAALSDAPRCVTVQLQPATIRAIDNWAADQDGVSSRAEAVRRLVDLGLISGGRKIDTEG